MTPPFEHLKFCPSVVRSYLIFSYFPHAFVILTKAVNKNRNEICFHKDQNEAFQNV